MIREQLNAHPIASSFSGASPVAVTLKTACLAAFQRQYSLPRVTNGMEVSREVSFIHDNGLDELCTTSPESSKCTWHFSPSPASHSGVSKKSPSSLKRDRFWWIYDYFGCILISWISMFPKKHLQHVFQAVLKSRLCMKGTSRILCSRGILAFIVAVWASSMKVSMCIRFVSANFRRFCWRPPGTRLATFKKGFLRLAPHGQSDQSPLMEGKKGEREERKRKKRKKEEKKRRKEEKERI